MKYNDISVNLTGKAEAKNFEAAYENCDLIRIKKSLMIKSNFSNVKEIEVNFKYFI